MSVNDSHDRTLLEVVADADEQHASRCEIERIVRVLRGSAERIVAAFREAQSRGQAAIQVDGQMIDYPVAYRAQALIDAVRNLKNA